MPPLLKIFINNNMVIHSRYRREIAVIGNESKNLAVFIENSAQTFSHGP